MTSWYSLPIPLSVAAVAALTAMVVVVALLCYWGYKQFEIRWMGLRITAGKPAAPDAPRTKQLKKGTAQTGHTRRERQSRRSRRTRRQVPTTDPGSNGAASPNGVQGVPGECPKASGKQ